MALREDQIRRYARHVLLPDVGGVGQERLLASTVAIDPRDARERIAFEYLVAAGVGTIAIATPAPELVAHARALNPDVQVIVGDDPRAAHLPEVAEPDPLIAAGAAATILLHRLATAS